MVVAVPLGYVVLLDFLFSRRRSFFLYFLTCDMCLRFGGCRVVLDVELYVSARHHNTRVLLPCTRRLVRLLVAPAARGVGFMYK